MIRPHHPLYVLCVRHGGPFRCALEDDSGIREVCQGEPQKVTYGTPGVGTNPHLAMEELSMITGIQLVHMPFKGGRRSNTALLGGHIDAISDSTSWGPLVDAGKFRLLVTYAPQRMPRYPDVPTLKEAGYDMVYSSPLFRSSVPRECPSRLWPGCTMPSRNPWMTLIICRSSRNTTCR